MRLRFAADAARELTEASAFYERTFGLRPEFAAPDGSYAQLDTGPTKLAFASPADKPHGQRVAYLRDPFGTLIELATPL